MQLSRLKFQPSFVRFKRKQKKVKFQIAASNATEVFLVGDFNAWEKEDTPLRRAEDGMWNATLKLCSGRYEYKFIVDGEWMTDPVNVNTVSNDLGTTNSVITITT